MQQDGETGSGSDDTILKNPVLTALAAIGLIVFLAAFDLEFAYEIGQSRVEHRDADKDWYYRDEILITVTKRDTGAADNGGDG